MSFLDKKIFINLNRIESSYLNRACREPEHLLSNLKNFLGDKRTIDQIRSSKVAFPSLAIFFFSHTWVLFQRMIKHRHPTISSVFFLFLLLSMLLIPQQLVTHTEENGESKGRERWIATLRTLTRTRSLESHLIPRKHLPPPLLLPSSLSTSNSSSSLFDRKLTAFIQEEINV